MAIYPDKDKDGQHTGRWRVELQRGKNRYRKRWKDHADAVKDEEAVLAAWDAGEALPAPGQAPGAPEVHTFETVIPLAKGLLWAGNSSEADSWAHVGTIASILGRNTRLDDVDTQKVNEVIRELVKRKLADGTVNRYLSHLRTFLVWAKDNNYRTRKIENPQDGGVKFNWREESEGRIRWIEFDEEAAIKRFLTSKNTPEPHAIWKFIKVAIETGCRRDELITVELGQINGTRLHLWKTKTKTPRTVPMTQETSDTLRELVETGTMPSRRNLRSWWGRIKDHLGLQDDEDFVFHCCRHTRATRLVDANINILVIQKWLGHKRIETTQRYAHVRDKTLEAALEAAGEYEASRLQNLSISAVSRLPQRSPTGGGNGTLSAAA